MLDFIKIKAEHISPEFSDANIGTLVRYQFLVSRLKRVPTEKETHKELAGISLVTLRDRLSTLGVSLDYIATKVLEDVDYIETRRVYEREKKRKQRDRENMSRGTIKDSPRTEKRREEEIREDNKKVNKKEIILNLDFIDNIFKPIVTEWIEYKKQTHRFNYKQMGLEKWYKCLQKDCEGRITEAQRLLDEAIAKNWLNYVVNKGANYANNR